MDEAPTRPAGQGSPAGHASESALTVRGSYGSLGIISRLLYQSTAFVRIILETPPQGYLVGMASNAIRSLDWVKHPDARIYWFGLAGWAEDGFSRHIVELGWFFGLGYIGFRVWLWIKLLFGSLLVAKQMRDGSMVLLTGFLAPLLLFMEITGQGTLLGFVWFGLGLAYWQRSQMPSRRRAYEGTMRS